MLVVSFAIIFVSAKTSLALKNKYPKVNCSLTISDMSGNMDLWQKQAIEEFQINTALEAADKRTRYEDQLQCFCKYQDAQGVNKKFVYEQTNTAGDTTFSEPICQTYTNDILKSKIIGQSIAFIIVAVNIVLKLTSIKLCEWVGEET